MIVISSDRDLVLHTDQSEELLRVSNCEDIYTEVNQFLGAIKDLNSYGFELVDIINLLHKNLRLFIKKADLVKQHKEDPEVLSPRVLQTAFARLNEDYIKILISSLPKD